MPTRKQHADAAQAFGDFDWASFDAMSDEDMKTAWTWDQDTSWPTEAELATFDFVPATESGLETPREAAE